MFFLFTFQTNYLHNTTDTVLVVRYGSNDCQALTERNMHLPSAANLSFPAILFVMNVYKCMVIFNWLNGLYIIFTSINK